MERPEQRPCLVCRDNVACIEYFLTSERVMANLTYPELAEITNESLPVASKEALIELRTKSCSSVGNRFRLQSQQVFLRRVLSPDSPTRNLLVVHGTGTGKTCTAIQIAEEYILRPEYQDKKVLVLASAAVQDNFRKQIFDMSRVNITPDGLLESKQCTGTRYLEALRRVESEPKNWNNPETRARLTRTADKLINEFYDLNAYVAFANEINKQRKKKEFEQWIHETFDNRLLIVDEAHAIRTNIEMFAGEATEEAVKKSNVSKEVSRALQTIVQTADNVVLVLLTATPMFDTFDEILFYFNLFLWNDRKQPKEKTLEKSDFFTKDGELEKDKEIEFRTLCQQYVSYIRGESPFTFPFRLPPPKPLVRDIVTKGYDGTDISPDKKLQYLHTFMVSSTAQGTQLEMLKKGKPEAKGKLGPSKLMEPTLVVFPDNAPFSKVFEVGDTPGQYKYKVEPFLTRETLMNHSAKFATVISSIEEGKGLAFVYSNYVEAGSRLFAMALEEHGYISATGSSLLQKSYKGPVKGKYLLLAEKLERADLAALAESKTGDSIRIIVSSPIAAEGVDFRNVRQIHVLDPWWNMSRIEQVIGRGLRTCSHAKLPTSEQNCTVYLHVVRTDTDVECYDEYIYRTLVEPKATKIARVRRILMESSIDCSLQLEANSLPEDWKNLEVSQIRSQDSEQVVYRLGDMLAPTFDTAGDVKACNLPIVSEVDPDHVRPLSTYTDISDEVLNRAGELFLQKPIWERTQLFTAMLPYSKPVVIYNLQYAIQTGRTFRDPLGRSTVLESKGSMYALRPIETSTGTLVERITRPPPPGRKQLYPEPKEEAPKRLEVKKDLLASKYTFTDKEKLNDAIKARFSEKILNSYVFDHFLSEDERRSYLRAYPEMLLFSDRLKIPDTDIYVLGHNTFDPPEVLVAEKLDKFNRWNEALVERFLANKDKLYGSVKLDDHKFTISKLKIEDGKAVRLIEKKAKTYSPIVCGTGIMKSEPIDILMKQLDKEGKGNSINPTLGNNCVFTELLMREEHECVWITPEELSVLFEDPKNKERIKKEFSK